MRKQTKKQGASRMQQQTNNGEIMSSQYSESDPDHSAKDIALVPSLATIVSSPTPMQGTSPVEDQVDAAWIFLHQQTDVQDAAVAAVDLPALRRRIDWHIVPIMFLCYTMQFLDKVILNYAGVMGLKDDLHFAPDGNEFSNVATFLFVGLLCFEIPNIYLLQRFPAAKWLGFNVFSWGIATACGAAATNYSTLVVSRVFLGIFEATISPSLMLISSQWYTKSEQAPRFAFWYMGLGLGQIIGGAVSYGFQHVTGASIAGWRIMFLSLGCFTVALGICAFLFLPDTPMDAKWLSNTEKIALLKHVSVNQTGIANRKFRIAEIYEALVDPQIWLLFLTTLMNILPSGVVTTYSTTLIRTLGYDSKQAALMNMPSGAVSAFFTLLVGFGIQRQSSRWAWMFVCIIPAIIGGALMSFLPITNRAGILIGIYLVNSGTAALSILYSWTVANVAGATKRSFACVLVSSAFCIGNIISPQTFQARDAPDYQPAKLTVLTSQVLCLVLTFTLFIYYRWCNHRRQQNGTVAEEEYKSAETWSAMTDKENKLFKYSL